MRASQIISNSSNYRITPAQRRLSAGVTGAPGLRTVARRSAMPAARKAEFAAAITGGLLILSTIIGLLAM
jgi:hypothetical protein